MKLPGKTNYVMTTLLLLFSFYCALYLVAIFILSVLEVNGDNSFFEYFATMGLGKALTDKEKEVIIKESAKGTSFDVIAEITGRHVDTVKRFLKDPSPRKKRSDAGCSKTVTDRDMRKIVRQLRRNPGQTSKSIFTSAGLPEVPKTTRNDIIRSIASFKAPLKLPPLTPRHKILRMEWAKKYMKMDMSHVLFTDETRGTLDGPDGWAKGWVLFGSECHQRLRRQQQGGGVMIWAGIMGDRLVGPVRVPDGVKVTSASYCNILKNTLEPWLDDLPLLLRRNLIFMHDNAPSHSARATKEFLASLGIHGEKLMDWPPCSPDLNPIENFWAIIKRNVYADGQQFTSKLVLWEAIDAAARKVPPSVIKKLTDSMSSRVFEVIKLHGGPVGR